jgi:DNA-binding Lrp family transcriptional regulator
MVEAYLLIQNDMGSGPRVAEGVRAVPGVVLVQSVTGPYDVVARVQAEDLDALSTLVDQVQRVPGITRTMTCPVLAI